MAWFQRSLECLYAALGIALCVVIGVPLAALVVALASPFLLAAAVDLGFWAAFRFPRILRGGRVLVARWMALPCAVRGRLIAVRKDMGRAMCGGRMAYIREAFASLGNGASRAGGHIPDPPLQERGPGKQCVWEGATLTPVAAISIALGCLEHTKDAGVRAVVAESHGAAHMAAWRIQRAWGRARADPCHRLCRERLLREFAELREIVVM